MARASQPEDTPAPEVSENAPDDASAVETGPEEDWGITPPRSGMSRETKLGFAFVLVLMVVFGFVVYKKIEHNRAARGELLAGAQTPAPEETPLEPPADPATANDAQNPIADNSFPPVQNPFPEPAPAQLSPASWNQESLDPAPEQQMASTPPAQGAESVTSINQFPTEATQDFSPTETPSTQSFPPTAPFETTSAPAPAQTAPPVEEFNGTPFPDQEFAQAPAPQGFEAPAQIPNQNESPEQPTEMVPAQMEPGNSGVNPFGEVAMPAQTEPPADEPEDEQFSTQSQTVVQEPPAQPVPSAMNPFGELPGTESTASTPAETPTAQIPAIPAPPAESGSDPFAVNPAQPMPTEAQAFEPTPAAEIPSTAETDAFPPVGVTSETVTSTPPESISFPPVGQEPPVGQQPPVEQSQPVEVTQTNSLPAEEIAPVQTAPAEMPATNDPRFGDFQPATSPDQYESQAGSVPNELPSDVLTQLTSAEITGGTVGQMQPSDRPEVYVVRPGDNYWNISKRQYGTVRYFSALARYNQQRIPNPMKMRPGMKVLTPSREILESRNPDLFPKFAGNSGGVSNVAHQPGSQSGFFMDANGGPMYRVGPNDTLGGIAHKHLGRFSRWVEIYQLNRHRLKDPNALTLGDVLQLPPDASRVSMVRQATGVR